MSSALAIPRLCVIWAPLVSGLLIVAACFLDPDIGASGRKLAKSYAENPGWIQASAVSLRFAFAFLIIPAIWLIASVRERGPGWQTSPPLRRPGHDDPPRIPADRLLRCRDLRPALWGCVGRRSTTGSGNSPANFIFLTGLVGYVLALRPPCSQPGARDSFRGGPRPPSWFHPGGRGLR